MAFFAGNGLRLAAASKADSPVFAAFFAGYDEAFVLPDEKEDEDGFRACLELNHGAAYASLAERFGPFRELCVAATDSLGNAIGGANFIAMPDGDIVTANLNYFYVAPGARRRGNFGKLLEALREMIAGLFPGAAKVLIFIEQNDPIAMSEGAYLRDTGYTGLDQWRRLLIWARAGARVVDFGYVQPPLSAAQEPDASLAYSVLGEAGPSLSACVLRRHLERFFGISVMKGAKLEAEPSARKQLEELAAGCARRESVALLSPLPLLTPLGTRAEYAARYPLARTLREAILTVPAG